MTNEAKCDRCGSPVSGPFTSSCFPSCAQAKEAAPMLEGSFSWLDIDKLPTGEELRVRLEEAAGTIYAKLHEFDGNRYVSVSDYDAKVAELKGAIASQAARIAELESSLAAANQRAEVEARNASLERENADLRAEKEAASDFIRGCISAVGYKEQPADGFVIDTEKMLHAVIGTIEQYKCEATTLEQALSLAIDFIREDAQNSTSDEKWRALIVERLSAALHDGDKR